MVTWADRSRLLFSLGDFLVRRMYGRVSRSGAAKAAFDLFLQTGRKWWRILLPPDDADNRPIQLERYCSRRWYDSPLPILLKYSTTYPDDMTFAALRGLEGAVVTKRRCRRHYGISVVQPFKQGLEVHDSRVYFNPIRDKLYRRGWMQWSIKKVPENYHLLQSRGIPWIPTLEHMALIPDCKYRVRN